jgi:hypothetical protein
VSGARASAEQALAWLRERGEHFFEAEALRTRGDAERALGDAVSAEASYRAAIDVAHAQEARLFELRATNSLSRLLQASGRADESRVALQSLLPEITGAQDSVDLLESLELLAESQRTTR